MNKSQKFAIDEHRGGYITDAVFLQKNVLEAMCFWGAFMVLGTACEFQGPEFGFAVAAALSGMVWWSQARQLESFRANYINAGVFKTGGGLSPLDYGAFVRLWGNPRLAWMASLLGTAWFLIRGFQA